MNAARILTMFKQTSLTHVKAAPLGRWNIHNHRETTLKIKYANEDNCGISGNNYKNTTQILEKILILMMINIFTAWVTNQHIIKD